MLKKYNFRQTIELIQEDLRAEGITKLLSLKAFKAFMVSPTTRYKLYLR